MMKNVAVPIEELNAKAIRAEEKNWLLGVEVVTASQKQEKLDFYTGKLEQLETDKAAARAAIMAQEVSAEQKEDLLLNLEIDTDSQKNALLLQQREWMERLTAEDRDLRLEHIAEADALYDQSYGPQPMTQEEIAQKNADTIAHAEYVANEQYKILRQQEYPSIGDQLDALFHAGVFPSEMAAQIQAVKDKYPKPE